MVWCNTSYEQTAYLAVQTKQMNLLERGILHPRAIEVRAHWALQLQRLGRVWKGAVYCHITYEKDKRRETTKIWSGRFLRVRLLSISWSWKRCQVSGFFDPLYVVVHNTLSCIKIHACLSSFVSQRVQSVWRQRGVVRRLTLKWVDFGVASPSSSWIKSLGARIQDSRCEGRIYNETYLFGKRPASLWASFALDQVKVSAQKSLL